MDDEARCPVCGVGVVADIRYDAGGVRPDGAPMQTTDSRQLTEYSCGHAVPGPRLDAADPDRLDVERRSSEETVDPADPA